MSKKIFQVVETRPATSYWVYTIEAESEEEAKKKVEEAAIDHEDPEHFTEVDWDGPVEYEYQEIKLIVK